MADAVDFVTMLAHSPTCGNPRYSRADLPTGTMTREAFRLLQQQRSQSDPKLPLLESEPAWPAGWTPVMHGLSAAAERSGGVLTSSGFGPAQSALVRSALQGRLEELSGVTDAEALGHVISAGIALRSALDGNDE